MISEPFFGKKAWAIVQGNFQKLADFFKMDVTQKFELGISSNFLHSISTSICIRKCDKKFLHFRSHFLEKKAWAIVQGNFQKLAHFL